MTLIFVPALNNSSGPLVQALKNQNTANYYYYHPYYHPSAAALVYSSTANSLLGQADVPVAATSLLESSPSASPLASSSSSSSPSSSQQLETAYFTVWTDPNENAFTMLLPQGWKATGGTLRTISGTNDADFWFNATDPTNKEIIFAANALTYYILASPATGLVDGSVYPGSYSPVPNVFFYRNASDYIRQFALPFLQHSTASDIQITKITDYPIPTFAYSAITTEASGATALLSFTRGGEKYTMGLDIITAAWATGWYVVVRSAVSAPEKDFDKVTHLSKMILPTFTEKLQWAQNEIIQKEKRTGIRMDLQQFMENSINQRYAATTAAKDVSNQAWSDAMLGIHRVQNPATGETYEVPNNYQYWWVDPHGNLAGTSTLTNPNPNAGFTQLKDTKNDEK
jgi:hypothetical protein